MGINAITMGIWAGSYKKSLWYSTSELMPILANASSKYHLLTGTATTSTMGASLTGSSKWFGGVLGPDGKIYCIPNDATSILIIDPATGTATTSTMGADLTGSLTGSYKWHGGVLGPDGKIYCVPFNTTSILIIDKKSSIPALDIGACLSPHLNKF